MLLRAKNPILTFGPGELHHATLVAEDRTRFVLCQINPGEWDRLDHSLVGKPAYFLLDSLKPKLRFWPNPDRDYEVKVVWSEMHED